MNARRVNREAVALATAVAGLVALACAAAPSAEAATASCDGQTATVRSGKVIRGGPGDDVLIGNGRDQTILGGAGNDRICARGGRDVVRAGPGDDVVHGDGRGDRLYGGGGADRLYGDIIDDFLYGGPGDDSLIGGHGVDKMFGGEGNDLMRGGTNRDCFYGQGGSNTASFATATPPGVPGTEGVDVDLGRPLKGGCPKRGSGRAEGDGAGEVLDGISFVVGSAFRDRIVAPGAGVELGLEEPPAVGQAFVFDPVTPAPRDPGLIVRAVDGVPSQAVAISGAGSGAGVAASGAPLAPGPGCDAQLTCVPAAGAIGFVLAWGGDGADSISIGPGLSPSATVDLDGGPGDDSLTGSDYLSEVLFGGDSAGADALSGGGGADALVSEGGGPDSGPDTLSGGAGDDQLVTDYPCAGHSFGGGSGFDVAGFARAGVAIRARIGGEATLANGRCRRGAPTEIATDNEVLEGTPKADRLFGSNGPDVIWGREGADLIVGRRGADILQGFAGADLIDARDGGRDREITCGAGRDRPARVDRADPKPRSC